MPKFKKKEVPSFKFNNLPRGHMNPILKRIQKKLGSYFTYFKDDNMLVVSEDKLQLPFMFILMEDAIPGSILLSIAVDYGNGIHIADVAVKAREAGKVEITHPFYISNTDGFTYIDDEAFDRYELEKINIDTLVPISEAVN